MTGEAILGANVFRDIFASIRDIVGGRSAAYEAELQKARIIAENALIRARRTLDARGLPDFTEVEQDSADLRSLSKAERRKMRKLRRSQVRRAA